MDTKQNSKSWLLWLGAALVAAFMIIVITNSTTPTESNINVGELENIASDDRVMGNATGKVRIIEYSDFQCPACKIYAQQILHQSAKDYPEVALVYRYFPLPGHDKANLAARIAEAASRQNKFWEMHDWLYENQSVWSLNNNAETLMLDAGASLGMNTAQLKKDLDSQEIADRVSRNKDEATALGLTWTPSIIINGKLIKNISSYEQFRKLIEAELTPGN